MELIAKFLELLEQFGLTFVPLFVAMDAIGILPILLPLTGHMTPSQRRKVIRSAILTGFLLGLGFLAIGKGILLFMGIELSDFLIAGGLILFLLAARELVRRLGEGPATLVDVAGGCRDATLGDFVNTADALWAADIIRPVDPEIPGCALDGINRALQKLAEERQFPELRAVPHGTALPIGSQA